MAYNPTIWINDDGTGTVGTPVIADHMNNIEQGINNNDEQINVLSVDRGYLNSKNVTTSTDDCTVNGKYYGSSSVLNLPEPYSWVMYVIRYNDNFIYHTIHMGSGRIFFRLKTSSGWQTWQQIATTTKTPFSCTASTGISILSQNCFIQNDISYIQCTAKKTDGSLFADTKAIKLFDIPSGVSTARMSLSITGYSGEGSVLTPISGTATRYNNDVYVMLINPTNINSISVSGVLW